MPLSDGTRLGSYEILSALGAGGMGEVYAAIDQRLGRKIALKVLPAEFAADPDRAVRFEREARAIAALNHPNIVTVHSVETLDGLPVLTMELVEGRTLADLIPKQGLALDKLLQIAVPLADAISAAHEKGITHRDLKPTNVMVTPEGRVKVLDFGLAKLRGDTTAAQLAGDPTRAVTTAGHIVGTVAYMSPEQAEARAVDERSDIFSLGIVLYEMATGQRPFKGDTNVSVLASIVRDTPRPIADVRPDLPGDLVKIVRKALAKDPERRYQSAKDLRNDLDIVREDAASGALARPAQAAPTRGNRAARVWFAAAAVLGALATAVFLRTRLAEPHSGASVEATFTQLTFQPGMERFPSLSPDGKWIVYSAAGEGDEDIYLQSVSGQNAIDLTKDSRASDTQPVFSPDGERIAFRSEREGGGLFLMGRTGEAVRRLTRSGFTPTWSPDGRQIGYSTADSPVTPYSGRGLGELWVVDVGTGASRKISVTGDVQGGRQPAWSPDGAHIAFRSGLAIWTVAAGGGVATRVSADGGNEWLPVWSRDGRYIYCSGDRDGRLNLWRTPVDARTGRRTGAPERIAAPAGQATYFSISADGKHIAYSSLTLESNVQRVPIDGETLNVRPGVQWLTQGTRYWQYVRVSPDANLLALSTGLARFNELFVAGADGMSLRQVTPGGNPEWLPDGRTIIFGAEGTTPGGLSQISSIAADGSGLAPRIESGATGPCCSLQTATASFCIRTTASSQPLCRSTSAPYLRVSPEKSWDR
jgi:Tol biopolymer transport system component